jgi:hypothetical protein
VVRVLPLELIAKSTLHLNGSTIRLRYNSEKDDFDVIGVSGQWLALLFRKAKEINGRTIDLGITHANASGEMRIEAIIQMIDLMQRNGNTLSEQMQTMLRTVEQALYARTTVQFSADNLDMLLLFDDILVTQAYRVKVMIERPTV